MREKAILGNGVVHVCFHPNLVPKDPNDASKGVCGWTWSTPVKPTKSRMLSLSPLRTLLPRVMTSNRARHELIQLPTVIKVRLLGTRRQSGTVPVPVPDLAGDGDAPPSPSPICPESGTLPRPRPRFAGDGDAPPSPIPIGGSAPWLTELRKMLRYARQDGFEGSSAIAIIRCLPWQAPRRPGCLDSSGCALANANTSLQIQTPHAFGTRAS